MDFFSNEQEGAKQALFEGNTLLQEERMKFQEGGRSLILASKTGWAQNQRGAPHLLKLEKNNGCGYSSISRCGGGKKSKELMLNCPCSRIIY